MVRPVRLTAHARMKHLQALNQHLFPDEDLLIRNHSRELDSHIESQLKTRNNWRHANRTIVLGPNRLEIVTQWSAAVDAIDLFQSSVGAVYEYSSQILPQIPNLSRG